MRFGIAPLYRPMAAVVAHQGASRGLRSFAATPRELTGTWRWCNAGFDTETLPHVIGEAQAAVFGAAHA
jgi:hypothetical protein